MSTRCHVDGDGDMQHRKSDNLIGGSEMNVLHGMLRTRANNKNCIGLLDFILRRQCQRVGLDFSLSLVSPSFCSEPGAAAPAAAGDGEVLTCIIIVDCELYTYIKGSHARSPHTTGRQINDDVTASSEYRYK